MSDVEATQADGDPAAYETLVLGIGNVLWADEGFGIRAAEALNATYTLPANARIMDGGTQGIFLLPWVRSAKRLLIFDAIDFGLEPATLKVIEGEDVPRYMGVKKMSMHQAGFQEVLSSADLAGELPPDIALVGVQPRLLDDYGGSLTDAVRATVEPAVDEAVALLRRWGVAVTARPEPLAATELIGPGALGIGDYEAGRPQLDGENA